MHKHIEVILLVRRLPIFARHMQRNVQATAHNNNNNNNNNNNKNNNNMLLIPKKISNLLDIDKVVSQTSVQEQETLCAPTLANRPEHHHKHVSAIDAVPDLRYAKLSTQFECGGRHGHGDCPRGVAITSGSIWKI